MKLPVLPSICVYFKRPQVKEMRDYCGYRKCKIKTMLPSCLVTTMHYAIVLSVLTTINPGDMRPWDILRKV